MKEHQMFHLTDLNPVCLLRALGRDILMIIAAGLIAAVLSMTAVQILHQPEYTASATLAVSVKSGSYTSVVSNLSLSSEIADTFTQLFESNLFSGVARGQLGVSSLPGTLQASVIPETNLLTLKVTADSPADAFRTLKILLENYDTVSEYVFQNVLLKELDGPRVPTAPSNPVNRVHIAKLAFAVGAGMMILLLLALCVLTDTVQTTSAVQRKLDVKLFGTLHHEEKNKTLRSKLKKLNRGLLITMPVASFHFTEEVYRLGTKLQYAAQKGGRKVILVTSVLENEGKSTVTANLALALAQGNKKVLLIDADLHKAAQYKLLRHKPARELADILRGKAAYAPEYLEKERLYTLLSTTASDSAAELIASERMAGLLEKAREEMDYIIIDSPPIALFSDVEALADLADISLLVVRQDCAPAGQINDTADMLNGCRAELLGCIFNDVRSMPLSNDHHSYGYGYGYGYGGYGYGYGQSRKHQHGGKPAEQAEESHGRS